MATDIHRWELDFRDAIENLLVDMPIGPMNLPTTLQDLPL
jgi:hypothetical protein